jgi:hypothetical protein
MQAIYRKLILGNRINSPGGGGLGLCGLLFAALALSACRVEDHESFETPTDTLLTFQAKLARDDPKLEYTCLSERFKLRCNGLLGYLTVRDRVLDQQTLERFLLVRNDLRDNIVSQQFSPDDRSARMKVEVWGTAIDFLFRKEVLLRLRFADGSDQEAFLDVPASDLYRLSGARVSLDLGDMPAEQIAQIDPHTLRATEVRELWKIDGFERGRVSKEE